MSDKQQQEIQIYGCDNDNLKDYYCKEVNLKELQITQIASLNNISPKLVLFINKNSNYEIYSEIYSEKYKYTLLDIKKEERKNYIQPIKKLISKLHQCGVYHGDIKEDNIVMNKIKFYQDANLFSQELLMNSINDIKLIDFGLSKFITELKTEDLKDNMYDEEVNSVEELLILELNEVDFICF